MRCVTFNVLVLIFAVFNGGAKAKKQRTIFPYTKSSVALEVHNAHRNLHNAPALTWNKEIMKYAKGWCLKLAKKNLFKHSYDYNYAKKKNGARWGENLYVHSTWTDGWVFPRMSKKEAMADAESRTRDAINQWVAEKQYYDYENPDFGIFAKWGHFTQVQLTVGSTYVFFQISHIMSTK